MVAASDRKHAEIDRELQQIFHTLDNDDSSLQSGYRPNLFLRTVFCYRVQMLRFCRRVVSLVRSPTLLHRSSCGPEGGDGSLFVVVSIVAWLGRSVLCWYCSLGLAGWRRYLGTAFRRFSDCKKRSISLLPANVYASIGEYLVILPLKDMKYSPLPPWAGQCLFFRRDL